MAEPVPDEIQRPTSSRREGGYEYRTGACYRSPADTSTSRRSAGRSHKLLSVLCTKPTHPLVNMQLDNQMVSPDMVAIRWPTIKTPHFISRLEIPYMPPIILQCILCSSMAHRILQTSHTIGPANSIVLAKRLQTYRGEALAMMAESLATAEEEPSDNVLFCMIVFALTEVNRCIKQRYRIITYTLFRFSSA